MCHNTAPSNIEPYRGGVLKIWEIYEDAMSTFILSLSIPEQIKHKAKKPYIHGRI